MIDVESMHTNRIALGCSRPYQTSFGETQTAGWKCPPPPPKHYEIRPRKNRDGFDLISDRLRFDQPGIQYPTQLANAQREREVPLSLALGQSCTY